MIRFHRWYDTLQEPWRCLLMLLFVVCFVIVPVHFDDFRVRALLFVAIWAAVNRAQYVTRRLH